MKKILALVVVATAAAFAQSSSYTNTDLVGNWKSKGCETFTIGGQTGFLKRDFVFTAKTWQLEYTMFADPSCNVPLFTNKIRGDYFLGEATTLANTRKITWGQNAKFITPHQPDILAVLNQTGCGDAKIGLNLEREISVSGCMAFGVGSVKDYPQEFDLLKLEKGQLFTGLRKENMNLEVNRPTAIYEFPLVR